MLALAPGVPGGLIDPSLTFGGLLGYHLRGARVQSTPRDRPRPRRRALRSHTTSVGFDRVCVATDRRPATVRWCCFGRCDCHTRAG